MKTSNSCNKDGKRNKFTEIQNIVTKPFFVLVMGEISWKTASHPLCQVLTNFRASAIYVIHKHMILVLKAELPVLLTLELLRSD